MIAKLLTGKFNPLEYFSALPRAALAHWPLLTVLTAVAAFVCGLAALRMRRWREDEAARAVWLQITPPARLPRDGAEKFARSVEGVLHRTRRLGWAARHLAFEFVATDAGVSAGVWVPPAVSARTITELVRAAWPGARVTEVAVPEIGGRGGVVGREIVPRAGAWHPLIAPGEAIRTTVDRDTPDGLNQVLAALSERQSGETAVVQVIVAAHREAGEWGRLARGGARAVVNLADFALTIHHTTPSTHHQRTTDTAGNPVAAARRQAEATKKNSGPHLRVTVRAAVAGPVPARYRRGAAGRIAGGFDSIVTGGAGLSAWRVRGAGWRVDARRPGRVFMATMRETAALWHLPASSGVYGIDTSPARSHRPRHDIARAASSPARSARPQHDSARAASHPLQVPPHELQRRPRTSHARTARKEGQR